MFRFSSHWRTLGLTASLLFSAPAAFALPALQIYSPDAVWDAAHETWLITSNDFELWVIGDVGGKGTISDVDLVASVYGTGSVTIDPLMPLDPTPELNRPGYAGLVNHEEFASADDHIYWTIGDFTSTSDAIIDYQPGSTGTSTGEIKVFTVHVTGYDAVHFDAFDHYFTGNGAHYVFAPPSHDATSTEELPEPSALLLFGTGALGLVLSRRKA